MIGYTFGEYLFHEIVGSVILLVYVVATIRTLGYIASPMLMTKTRGKVWRSCQTRDTSTYGVMALGITIMA